MKTKRFLFILTFNIITIFYLAADNRVAVIYNGNTAVNRETYSHLTKLSKANDYNFEFETIKNYSSFNSDEYIAVIMLNTGRSSGVDPVILQISESLTDNSQAFCISLFEERLDLTIEYKTPSSIPEGIDGLTAASQWKHKGFKGIFQDSKIFSEMHDTWAEYILLTIYKRQTGNNL